MFASTLAFGFDQVPEGIHCNFGVSLSYFMYGQPWMLPVTLLDLINLLMIDGAVGCLLASLQDNLHDIIAFLVHVHSQKLMQKCSFIHQYGRPFYYICITLLTGIIRDKMNYLI
ncbi:hypothetical protein ACJX0J_016382, partial [Zea mays]